MLCCENFGRRHERCLIAILDGHEHRLQGDNRLSRADVPLQQTPHGIGRTHVGHDFAKGALLCGGGMKRQDLADGAADLVAGLEGDAGTFAHAAALQFKAELEENSSSKMRRR